MTKYAPKREDGLRAYVVSASSWGRTTTRIEWASNLADAKRKHGWTRADFTSITVRAATPADLEASA